MSDSRSLSAGQVPILEVSHSAGVVRAERGINLLAGYALAYTGPVDEGTGAE